MYSDDKIPSRIEALRYKISFIDTANEAVPYIYGHTERMRRWRPLKRTDD
jgi:hypothetical protein